MQSILLIAALISGLTTIACDWQHRRRRLFYLVKPLTTLLIIALAWLSLASAPPYRAWITLALVCCLIGDIALMWRNRRAFMLGLSSFLVGHLLLIGAFASDLPLSPLFWPLPALCVAGLYLLAAAAYARWLLPRTGSLKPAVLIYLPVLMTMVLTAVLRAGLTESAATRWVAVAALLFALSDAVLAYRKFVATPWWGQPVTLLTYFLAIGLMAWAH